MPLILSAIFTIAYRDLLKLLRDRLRLLLSLVFPFVFVGILGGSLDANLSGQVGYNFLLFVYTGVIAQTMFQSTASGIISLLQDKENDFAQEMFVAPVPRPAIIFGKVLGETLVALTQLVGLAVMGMVLGVGFSLTDWVRMLPIVVICCLLGGAFGTLIMANLNDQRKASQIFPFVIFPQFFVAGVFSPIQNLPWHLWALSRVAPMTYAVDLFRSIYYFGDPVADKVTLHEPWFNLLVVSVYGVLMILIGTWLFVRNERNK
jgi:ABC-2 type transport system permease protein